LQVFLSSLENNMPRISTIGAASTGSFGFELANPYQIEYLIVAGGGGAPTGFWPGAGGAGGYLSGTSVVTPNSPLVGVVGAGGTPSTNGSNSTFLGLTAIGGGCGAEYSVRAGNSGGSGGGGASFNFQPQGAGTAGQGNAGGAGSYYCTGGGGGANAAGSDASGTGIGNDMRGGNGGAGKQWLDGTYYAGGGGGMCGGGGDPGAAIGLGGIGGGGNGGSDIAGDAFGVNGTINTGGGGGGGKTNGGTGIIALRYPGPQRGTGGTVTSSGGYTYHYFYTSSTYIP
jgi:hypothetical protein